MAPYNRACLVLTHSSTEKTRNKEHDTRNGNKQVTGGKQEEERAAEGDLAIGQEAETDTTSSETEGRPREAIVEGGRTKGRG
ncbi:hypothetical protein E2542_SST20592 [Spatholobus suberectus]|nr:hypothetical protein E2542_SST20592 [Spatholobus suberectus]